MYVCVCARNYCARKNGIGVKQTYVFGNSSTQRSFSDERQTKTNVKKTHTEIHGWKKEAKTVSCLNCRFLSVDFFSDFLLCFFLLYAPCCSSTVYLPYVLKMFELVSFFLFSGRSGIGNGQFEVIVEYNSLYGEKNLCMYVKRLHFRF